MSFFKVSITFGTGRFSETDRTVIEASDEESAEIEAMEGLMDLHGRDLNIWDVVVEATH